MKHLNAPRAEKLETPSAGTIIRNKIDHLRHLFRNQEKILFLSPKEPGFQQRFNKNAQEIDKVKTDLIKELGSENVVRLLQP